jgi:plastocyanin
MRRSRREFLKDSGLAFAGFALLRRGRLPPAARIETIEMRSDMAGSGVWFDPVGLYIEPGTTVRWIVRENVHTTTAYHPRNDKHPLRIPERAAPWDSGFLVQPGDHFEITLTKLGVYDYYCAPHEGAGMVGRIVVGKPVAVGAREFDYWVGKSGTSDWRHVPDAARKAFPSVSRILAHRRVRRAAG